nr:MAG TPA: Glycoprotein [Caudoviricetes sp.]
MKKDNIYPSNIIYFRKKTYNYIIFLYLCSAKN